MENGGAKAFTLLDAYSPAEVARRVESAGVTKAALGIVPTLALGALAGAFVAFGSLFFLVAITESGLGFGVERLVGGVCFSLGLILVVVAGAELFTGNNLIVIAWADRKITIARLLRNWGLVFVANFAGSVLIVAMVVASGVTDAANGAVGETATRVAATKTALSFGEAFFRGVLCNALVCLAVWLAMAAHAVSDAREYRWRQCLCRVGLLRRLRSWCAVARCDVTAGCAALGGSVRCRRFLPLCSRKEL